MPSNHPLPAPPGQQQQQQQKQQYQQYQQQQQQERPGQQRPRAKSGFSFRSNHSHKSSGSSGHKIDLHETHEEKQSRRLTTKADPSMAITEAEPCEYKWRLVSTPLCKTFTHGLYSCGRKWSKILVGTNSSNSTSRQSGKPNRLVHPNAPIQTRALINCVHSRPRSIKPYTKQMGETS